MRINIVGGSGPMGRVHKPVFEAAGHEVVLSSVNNPREGVVDATDATRESDITIISVPIGNTPETIRLVAPDCTGALMDFTGVKSMSLPYMDSYGKKAREIGGLHPMYGSVENVAGENVVYCPTERSGPLCEIVVNAFKKARANVTRLDAKMHDKLMQAVQNERILSMMNQARELMKTGLRARDIYVISSRPTNIFIDLLARQVSPNNDKLYEDMLLYNPYQKTYEYKNGDYPRFAREVREFMSGGFLKEAQARAKELMKAHKQLCTY